MSNKIRGAVLMAKAISHMMSKEGGSLPKGQVGFAIDEESGMLRGMLNGSFLFELKDTHGLPLDFALDRVINEVGWAVDWPGFVEAARSNGWWDFQTFDVVCAAMIDAQIPRPMQTEIQDGLKRYMMKNLLVVGVGGRPTSVVPERGESCSWVAPDYQESAPLAIGFEMATRGEG